MSKQSIYKSLAYNKIRSSCDCFLFDLSIKKIKLIAAWRRAESAQNDN